MLYAEQQLYLLISLVSILGIIVIVYVFKNHVANVKKCLK